MHEFNSLSDSTKASYIAEAKIRNSVENNTWPTEKLFKPMKSAKPRKSAKPGKSRRDRERRNKVFNTALKTMATGVFLEAMRQEHLMIDPKFRLGGIAAYYEAGRKEFRSLSDEDIAPYTGEAMRSGLEESAKSLKFYIESMDNFYAM